MVYCTAAVGDNVVAGLLCGRLRYLRTGEIVYCVVFDVPLRMRDTRLTVADAEAGREESRRGGGVEAECETCHDLSTIKQLCSRRLRDGD